MTHSISSFWPLLLVVPLSGCGGRTLEAESNPDAGVADSATPGKGGSGGGANGGSGGAENVGGSGESGGSIAGGTGGGPGGSGGIEDGGPAGSGGSTPAPCTLSTGDPSCDSCMAKACMTQCYACHESTECKAFVACALDCMTGDAACMKACVDAHPDGVKDGLPLVGPEGCLREQCLSACVVGSQACELSTGNPDCDTCVAGHCMSECTTCADNPSCASLVECVLACPANDQTCLLQCASKHPGGVTMANALMGQGGCVPKHCSVECLNAPSQCDLSLGNPSCDACVSSHCLASCQSCADNPSCVALVECVSACPPNDQSCRSSCGMKNPGGIGAATAFAGDNGCVPQKCPVECAMGSNTCEVQSGNPACDACIRSECVGSCASCSENPDCLALVSCYFSCPSGDHQCQIGCATSHSGGVMAAGALIGPTGCVSADCSYWCP
ncbi:MAG TPA: hypothetical protein PLJ27_05410 [Polyangiaceae bacterium]|nr:hypothetical protein [Polyangiaceae bacterium]HNZ23049.1 hypothetical protein [Polyangiaceae bacterium]HOD21174.1 hypothetical protein [Polyangiaceae bacterium]HOH01811.1 hypothetical protein [Polyangiaceae bacterium]HOR34050.1 hypothetical protein [Polyangiaceae bacterium]